jgi:hypothetical protein
MLGYAGNFFCGWGVGILVITYSISFEFDSYGGEYSSVELINIGSRSYDFGIYNLQLRRQRCM